MKIFLLGLHNEKKSRSYLIFFFTVYFLFFPKAKAQNLFFEKITGKESNPVTQIHGIAKDSLGYIWIGSWNGAYRYDGRTFDFFCHNPTDKTSLPNNRIRNIISDKKLGLWFYTFDKKYVRFNYQLNSFKIIADNKVPKLIVEKLSRDSNFLNNNRIVNGKRYFLSAHQFTSLDIKSGKEYRYTANINYPGQLVDDYITDFFIDDENIIWLGTRGGDVYKANPNRNPFELHYSYRKATDNTKLATAKAVLKVNDEIWLGTDEGVLIYNKEGIDNNHPFYKSNSQTKFVRSFFKDTKGGIWIGGVNGLEYFNPKTNRCKMIIDRNLCPNLETWSVYAFEPSGNNHLWVGLYNGIARVNLVDETIRFINLTKEVDNHSVMDILSVNDRELWLATEGNGVVRLTLNNKGGIDSELQLNTFQKNIKNTVSGNIIYALHKDKRGNIWVGTSEGLDKIDTKTNPMRIEKVLLQSETPNLYISSITDDNKGNLWIAHKQGISMMDIVSNKISNYRKEDQFGSWTFSERAFYKDVANQRLYFGDKNGYVTFEPNEIKSIVANRELILKTLYLSNEKVIPMDTINGRTVLTKDMSQTQWIVLDYENRNFAIEFASLNYNKTNKEVYEYMLEGYEDKWIKTTSTKITYNRVPPGNYFFKVRIVSTNDIKSPIKTIEVHIDAPWYATWLAKTIYLILMVAFVYWILKEILYRDRLKNEIQLQRLNTEKQEELNREKLAFFTNISHDLKTPLTLIVDPLKQLENKSLSVKEKALYFSIINRNLSYLTKLIHQILDFRKSEIGKLTLNPTTQDFNNFIQECYNTFKFIAIKRNIDFKLQVAETPLNCYLDFDKAEQILINIVSNALKYTPDGGFVLFSAKLNKEKNVLEITVKDNGIGIETKELEKIFEPFNNVGSSPFHGYSSGIGLSLTQSLVQFLNGTITIESVINQGTKVLISLPYVSSQEEPQPRIKGKTVEPAIYKAPKEIQTTGFETNKLTVLIVEDNPDVQAYLSNELQNDYDLIQEYNGKKGLEAAIQYIPDIIISDVMMPEMEGTELCKELKLNENTCHVPIILLTARASDENQIEGFELGAEAYVMKPFSVDVLKAQIKSVLENRMILLNRLSGIKDIKQLQEESPNLDKIFLSKMVELITNHIEETDFNSDVLAQELNISQRQLYRKLKATSGCTVHEFITKVRMDQAAILLKNSDLNISQIAYKVGFSEASNFSRTFSKHFGCSPSQYMK